MSEDKKSNSGTGKKPLKESLDRINTLAPRADKKFDKLSIVDIQNLKPTKDVNPVEKPETQKPQAQDKKEPEKDSSTAE